MVTFLENKKVAVIEIHADGKTLAHAKLTKAQMTHHIGALMQAVSQMDETRAPDATLN